MSRIKTKLFEIFTRFSPVYHITITIGSYNIDKIKEGARPQGRPTKSRKVLNMVYYYFANNDFICALWRYNQAQAHEYLKTLQELNPTLTITCKQANEL